MPSFLRWGLSPRRPDYELIESLQVITPQQLRVVYRKPYSPALLSWMIGMLVVFLVEILLLGIPLFNFALTAILSIAVFFSA